MSAFCEIAYLLCVIFKKQGPVIGINVILVLLVGTGTNSGASAGLVIVGFVCTLVYFIGTYVATRYSVKHLEV